MAPGDGHGAASLRDYLQVIRRRKWVILQAIVLVPVVAALYSFHQTPVYQASAQVLLSGQDFQSALSATPSPTSNLLDPTVVATQAQLATVPEIARLSIAQLHLSAVSPEAFLHSCSATSSATTDILSFTCRNGDAPLAVRMVNAYSYQYTQYRRRLDTNAIDAARREVAAKVRQLVAQNEKGALYTTLVEREQELQTQEELQTANATVVKAAASAGQVSPRTKRNIALGLVLGIGLGVLLAFLREALDTRVRTAQEISSRLSLPMLGRIPEPSKKLRTADRLVMLEEPSSVSAEAFRVLRTNLEFSTLERDARTIMITSAVEQEGKSTTIANLAVALARSGQRVILIDLDLRRPYLHKFFDLGARPGITQVVLGRATLADALVRVPIAQSPSNSRSASRSTGSGPNGSGSIRGQLAVLGAGPTPPDPGEFVSTDALAAVLAQLRKVADVVLVDAPPLLHVGDALVLSAKVDAILLATRMERIRRPMLTDVGRALQTAPSPVLGFVVTGAEAEAGYGYGYGYGYEYGNSDAPRDVPERDEDLVR
jgi:succinoglycan biosynthesis transport protein ExoP